MNLTVVESKDKYDEPMFIMCGEDIEKAKRNWFGYLEQLQQIPKPDL